MPTRSLARRTAPLLVTGMPRSGTTWLARLLSSAQGAALTGREPMNPRGRQYALGGTLPGWSRLHAPTFRQRFALRSSYLGINPLVYSRYGHNQLLAAAPWSRLIVKDPFAMLSLPAIHRTTSADAVLLYRHPGAALASYRRMGWTPDVEELQPLVIEFLAGPHEFVGLSPAPTDARDEVSTMAWFWNCLYAIALHDATELGSHVLILAHEDVAGGGPEFVRALFSRLGLRWSAAAAGELTRAGGGHVDRTALHNFDRNPARVAHEWADSISPDERTRLEAATSRIHEELRARSFTAHTQPESAE